MNKLKKLDEKIICFWNQSRISINFLNCFSLFFLIFLWFIHFVVTFSSFFIAWIISIQILFFWHTNSCLDFLNKLFYNQKFVPEMYNRVLICISQSNIYTSPKKDFLNNASIDTTNNELIENNCMRYIVNINEALCKYHTLEYIQEVFQRISLTLLVNKSIFGNIFFDYFDYIGI